MLSTTRRIVSPFALLVLAALAAPVAGGAQSAGRSRVSSQESRVTRYAERSDVTEEYEQQADSAYAAAREALIRRDYTRAATLFQNVVDRFPKSSRAPESLYFRAYALSRSGGSMNLSRALSTLETLKEDYPSAYDDRDGSTLRIQVCGELAKQGDERCASEVVKEADPDRSGGRSTAVSSRSNQSRSCPRENDDNDDRIAALNALMQMNGERAMPVLERLLKDRQTCDALRKQAVFIVSQKRGDSAADLLMDVARNDPSSEVREAAVFWLGQTNSERAVDILNEILEKTNDVELQKKAIFSLTQNRSPRAQQIIRDYAMRESAPKDARSDAIFWLGQRRDPDNGQFLRSLYGRLRDDELKDKLIFSLSQQPNAENQRWLLDLAQNDREDVEMRKKALFWAGQQRSVDVAQLAGLYDRLKDREMKDQVIFVLTQRRESAAIDKLVSIAKTESDRELRKKAIFWLGQTNDPRVLKLLEDIISGRPPER